jgi:plastocyanin
VPVTLVCPRGVEPKGFCIAGDRRRIRNLWTALFGVSAAAVLGGCADGPVPNDIATPAEAEVVAIDRAFEPETLTVEAGTEVTFRNEDDTDHIWASGRPGEDGYTSSTLAADGGWMVRVYPSAGGYEYYCMIHDDMSGTIEVVE